MPHLHVSSVCRLATFCVVILLLSACSGGNITLWFGRSLSLYSLDSDPATPKVGGDVTVTAKVSTSDDIGDEDIAWSWDQTDGAKIQNIRQEALGHTARLHFTAPTTPGNIELRVTVQGKGLSDTAKLRLYVHN